MPRGNDWEEEFHGKFCPSLLWPAQEKACKSYALYFKEDYCFCYVD